MLRSQEMLGSWVWRVLRAGTIARNLKRQPCFLILRPPKWMLMDPSLHLSRFKVLGDRVRWAEIDHVHMPWQPGNMETWKLTPGTNAMVHCKLLPSGPRPSSPSCWGCCLKMTHRRIPPKSSSPIGRSYLTQGTSSTGGILCSMPSGHRSTKAWPLYLSLGHSLRAIPDSELCMGMAGMLVLTASQFNFILSWSCFPHSVTGVVLKSAPTGKCLFQRLSSTYSSPPQFPSLKGDCVINKTGRGYWVIKANDICSLRVQVLFHVRADSH